MYQALYRKYRPKTFKDVSGQPHVTVTLQNEILSSRIGHAYLFIGSRGTGKTTCAKIFAKAVNCEHLDAGSPCCECEMCHEIDSGEAMDIIELDAASNNGVNDIREICESTAFTPAKAKYRVYIIDEAHMLSPGAFNALLKTLEEPPAHVIFILATTEVHKIPATVLSRCQRFEFHKISIDDIASRVEYVASQENASITKDAAFLIAKIADGAMRDALAILDKCIGIGKSITVNMVADTVGLASGDQMFLLMQAILQEVPQDALAVIDEFDKGSKNMMRLTLELIGNFRNIMLIKTLEDAKKLMLLSGGDYEKLVDLAREVTLEKVIFIMNVLQDSLGKMGRGCDSKAELEMCMIKLCSPQLSAGKEAMISRLDELEKKISDLASDVIFKNLNEKAKIQTNATEKSEKDSALKETIEKKSNQILGISEESARCAAEPAKKNKKNTQDVLSSGGPGVDITDLHKHAQKMENWNEVLDILKGYSHTIAMAFKGSNAYISGDFVLIDSKNEMAFELLRKSSQRDKIRVAIKSVTGRAYKLGPYSDGASDGRFKSKIDVDPLNDLADRARKLGIDVTEL